MVEAIEHGFEPDAVVRDRAVRIELACHAVRDGSTEAESDDPDPAVDGGACLQPREGRIDIAQTGLGVELPDELERPRHVLVVLQVDVALDAPEQVRHQGHVAELGEAVRHATHVTRDAARLVEQHDAEAGAALGDHEVGVELAAVVRRDPDRIRRHETSTRRRRPDGVGRRRRRRASRTARSRSRRRT